MKWFEEHIELIIGSDTEKPGSSYRAIAQISDEVLDGKTMIDFVRGDFLNQKAFGEFLGVGESTVAGWMKSGSFPDYAKRATLAAYHARKYFRLLKEAKHDSTRPKVVKDGDRFMIVRFKVDEVGVAIGEILARDIPTEKAALVFAGGIRAWELLRETEHLIDHELESMDPEHSAWIQDLKDEIGRERSRTFAHENEIKRAKHENELKRKQSENFDLDSILFPEDKAKTDNPVEGEAGDD